MTTFGSLFTGFGGADIGAMAADLNPIWGLEYDPKIAAVANDNLGGHVRVADILDEDPATYPYVDVLHASPPCPNFSVAKTGGEETPHDIALADQVSLFASGIRPKVFTLENVYAYAKSRSWRRIEDTLLEHGYWVTVDIVNAADFGVPQTRKRMIVRAIRDSFVPILPPPEPWVGWYDAIDDLIPDLPETQFANWQIARLPDGMRGPATPAFAVTGQTDGLLRAFIVDCQGTGDPNEDRGLTIRDSALPVFTVTCGMGGKRPARGFIIGKTADKFGDGIRYGNEPDQTIGANEHGSRIYTGRRVVSMTPRCLARFQLFPDSYRLPDQRTLAAKGIGNAVPPLMYRKIIRQLVEFAF